MNLKPLLVLAIGMLIGYSGIISKSVIELNSSAIRLTLFALFIVIGIDMGREKRLWESLSELKGRVFAIAFAGLAGSILGGTIASILTGTPFSTGVASAAGSGYYSITTLMLKEVAGPSQALVGFLSNLLRELIVIVGMPIIAKIWGKAGCVGAAGATAMDTALPFIIKSVGKEIGVLSFASGVIITILVPFLVPTIYRLLYALGW